MSAEPWTPTDSEASALGIIVPGRSIKHRCGCGAEFFDTGDAYADDQRFLRHEAKCWQREGEAAVDAKVAERENEPLAQIDKEQVDYLRAAAERKKDTTVKGVTGWSKRERRRKKR